MRIILKNRRAFLPFERLRPLGRVYIGLYEARHRFVDTQILRPCPFGRFFNYRGASVHASRVILRLNLRKNKKQEVWNPDASASLCNRDHRRCRRTALSRRRGGGRLPAADSFFLCFMLVPP